MEGQAEREPPEFDPATGYWATLPPGAMVWRTVGETFTYRTAEGEIVNFVVKKPTQGRGFTVGGT